MGASRYDARTAQRAIRTNKNDEFCPAPGSTSAIALGITRE
jgi:hypothetical protein